MVRVLREKFQWNGYSVLDTWNKIARFTNVVEPTQTLSVIVHDPPDNRILECAAEANSDYIVSADKDLLRLGTFAGVPILRSADFIQQISSSRHNRE